MCLIQLAENTEYFCYIIISLYCVNLLQHDEIVFVLAGY